MQSCGVAALFEYFAYFVVSKIYAGSPLHAVLFLCHFPARCARAHILLSSVVSKSTCRAFVSIRQIRGFFSRMLRVFRG